MTIDSVRSYLKEIGRYPLLTKEQEIFYAGQVKAMISIELALNKLQNQETLSLEEQELLFSKSKLEIEKIRRQGKIAKEKMLVANLRLVVAIYRQEISESQCRVSGFNSRRSDRAKSCHR